MDLLDMHNYSNEQFVRQRHLHNLRSILVKNVSPKYTIKSIEDLCRHSFYFTLHEDCRSPTYYESTRVIGTLNPVWEKINLKKDGCSHFKSPRKEFVCIRIWMCRDVNIADEGVREEVIVRWDVNFSALIAVEKEHLIYGQNVILFEFDNGLYTAPFKDKIYFPLKTSPKDLNPSNFRMSYRLNSLKRLQLTLRAINEVNKKSEEVKSIISAILNRRKKFEKEEVERLRCRLDVMKTEHETRCLNLQNIQMLCDSQHSLNEIDDLALKENYISLSSSWQMLHESKKNYFDVRDQLIQTGAHLVRRRKQLLTDMASIYPVTKDPIKGKYYIAGVHLPNSEELSGHDEVMLAVALGFTCHLVKQISLFLDVPLRYPINHQGSRSTIRDDIINVLSDKERDFPLYTKGRERYQFEYAVYILNKDIVQLRHYCGMSTSSLGSTLYNLHSLLNDKLGVVKTTRSNAFASQHVIIPPSFGGPLPDVSTRNQTTNSIPVGMSTMPTSMLGTSMTSDSTSSTPRDQSSNVIYHNQNIFSSVSNISQMSSSSMTSEISNIKVNSSLKVKNSVAKLISARSLSPSVESLASDHEGHSFLKRKLKALKILRTSSSASVSSSPMLTNSKFNSIRAESEMWPEGLDLHENGSGFVVIGKDPTCNDDDDDDGDEIGESLTLNQPSTYDQLENTCTDATLNEVLSILSNLSSSAKVRISDRNVQDSEKVPPSNCNGLQGDQDIFFGESKGPSVSANDGNYTPPSSPTKSVPSVFKNLMINNIETPDNCLSSEDEVLHDS